MLEFYASTEGNVWLYNVEGRVGSLGRVPPYLAATRSDRARALRRRRPGAAARRGRLLPALRGRRIGEALGRIGDDAPQRFEGYSQAAETEKKILRDVFAPGDAWMRTGDLMRRDAEGFYYFVDRIGDTFRWKGENVATPEVAAALPGVPGRRRRDRLWRRGSRRRGPRRHGAAARLPARSIFPPSRARSRVLPRYARPLFLRLTREIATTETHKPKRAAYLAEGFDPARIGDPLYVYDGEASAYVALDAERFAEIASGAMRV